MEDMMNKIQNVLNDEESMKQLRELAGMLSNGEHEEHEMRTETGIDPVKLVEISQVLQTASQDDNNIRLMSALRPLLKEDTRKKLDMVIKLYRLMNIYPALKQSGIGGSLLDNI